MDAFTHALDLGWQALRMALLMGWQIFWGLALGFLLSAIVDVAVPKRRITQLLPDASPRSLAIATVLGAVSSSCSYAAVAMTRSIFRKGADFTAAIAFQFASTNLVIELGILLAVLIAWQFTLAEFAGGLVMIVVLALLFRVFLHRERVDAARRQAEAGLAGEMEGHAEMMMSEGGDESPARRLWSAQGLTAVSHAFVMNAAMVWKDIVLGLAIAGAIAAWVPPDVWRALFLADHPLLASVWGAILGPLIAVASFTCSIGNVPLAAVLWKGGISFGGVIAFLFADLIILPILNIYRKYYGRRMTVFLAATFYAAMVLAAWLIEALFAWLGLIPSSRLAQIVAAQLRFNYTSWLDLIFFAVAAVLVWRFATSGGPAMMREMAAGHCGHAHHSGTAKRRRD